MSFVIKRDNKYVVKGGIVGSETTDINKALKFKTEAEAKEFMKNEFLRPEKHTIENVNDGLSFELFENKNDADEFAKKHKTNSLPYKTGDGKFNGFIVWYRDNRSVPNKDSKTFVVNYKDRKFKVTANDHQEAANKVIKNVKDGMITPTTKSGRDVAIYVLQSDVDKNLYFKVGAKFSVKEGSWTYQKYEMNGMSPEALLKELLNSGWHKLNNFPAHLDIIDGASVNDGEDKEFLKNAIEEMERYVSNWSFMTAKEKKDIGMDRNQLKNRIEEYRRKLATKDSKISDAVTLTSKEYYDILDKIPRFENVEIYFTHRLGQGLEAALNWSAIGSVDTAKAKKFINDLQKAVSIVDDLNKKYKGGKVSYTDSNSVKDEYIKGPRGEFKLSEKTKSELESEGYGFHHSFEKDGKKYYVLTKNNTAVACTDEARNTEDERLSPMTYKKLRELGYNEKKWAGMSQEEANKIVAKGNSKSKSSSKEENSNKEGKKSSETAKSKESTNTSSEYEKAKADYEKLQSEYERMYEKMKQAEEAMKKAENNETKQKYSEKPDYSKYSKEVQDIGEMTEDYINSLEDDISDYTFADLDSIEGELTHNIYMMLVRDYDYSDEDAEGIVSDINREFRKLTDLSDDGPIKDFDKKAFAAKVRKDLLKALKVL